ncbi:MAG: FAD-binding oxidoreductase [Chloroflexi bacterium]|nr:MAG: FAD-binding oxidoreductase [Chloroflexota bacterium]
MTTGSTTSIPGRQVAAQERQGLTVDGVIPSRVVHPQDLEEAAGTLRLCAQAGAGVVVVGGGTQLRLGAPPRRFDVALVTDRLDRLLEYEPADLTCRVQAGMKVEALQAELGRNGQWLPLDPPSPDRATIGGMVAANACGPARARYGSVRDWVIGITVAYPSGAIARAGGRVVKNVAGYDLMKLHTGALGTLGVILEVNLKVQARPEQSLTLQAGFDRAEQAAACALALTRQYLQPAVAAAVDRRAGASLGLDAETPFTLALRLEGYRTEVDAAAALVEEAVVSHRGRMRAGERPAELWAGVRDWVAPQDPEAVVLAAWVPTPSGRTAPSWQSRLRAWCRSGQRGPRRAPCWRGCARPPARRGRWSSPARRPS